MNTLEMKIYILEHAKDLIDLEIMPHDDGSFYLSAESADSKCGALFLESGRMHPMARISFDSDEDDLMDRIEDAAKEFIARKAA